MAQKKYGEDFITGIKRNMEAQGISPKPAKVNMPLQTLKYLPGEMVKTTKRFAGSAIRGALAPARAIGRLIKKKR